MPLSSIKCNQYQIQPVSDVSDQMLADLRQGSQIEPGCASAVSALAVSEYETYLFNLAVGPRCIVDALGRLWQCPPLLLRRTTFIIRASPARSLLCVWLGGPHEARFTIFAVCSAHAAVSAALDTIIVVAGLAAAATVIASWVVLDTGAVVGFAAAGAFTVGVPTTVTASWFILHTFAITKLAAAAADAFTVGVPTTMLGTSGGTRWMWPSLLTWLAS